MILQTLTGSIFSVPSDCPRLCLSLLPPFSSLSSFHHLTTSTHKSFFFPSCSRCLSPPPQIIHFLYLSAHLTVGKILVLITGLMTSAAAIYRMQSWRREAKKEGEREEWWNYPRSGGGSVTHYVLTWGHNSVNFRRLTCYLWVNSSTAALIVRDEQTSKVM